MYRNIGSGAYDYVRLSPANKWINREVQCDIDFKFEKRAEEDPLEWHRWLPRVLMCYHSKVHSSLNFTSLELMFSQRMKCFDEGHIETVGEEKTLVTRRQQLKTLIQETREKALENLFKIQKASENRRNKKNEARIKQLQIGDLFKKI